MVELNRRDLMTLLGGALATTLAGCSTRENTNDDTDSTNTMNLEVESQSTKDLTAINLDESYVHRITDEEHGKVLYMVVTNNGWTMDVTNIDGSAMDT